MTGCKPQQQPQTGRYSKAKNKVQRHGCYQPTPMGNTPYGHSIIITELLTWVHGRMGLVALHDRVQTTTTTSDCKTFTANKLQRHGCYQPTLMCILTEILTWVHGWVVTKNESMPR